MTSGPESTSRPRGPQPDRSTSRAMLVAAMSAAAPLIVFALGSLLFGLRRGATMGARDIGEVTYLIGLSLVFAIPAVVLALALSLFEGRRHSAARVGRVAAAGLWAGLFAGMAIGYGGFHTPASAMAINLGLGVVAGFFASLLWLRVAGPEDEPSPSPRLWRKALAGVAMLVGIVEYAAARDQIEGPSPTIERARSRGVFVRELNVLNWRPPTDEGSTQVEAIWVERQRELRFYFWPRDRGFDRVVARFAPGEEATRIFLKVADKQALTLSPDFPLRPASRVASGITGLDLFQADFVTSRQVQAWHQERWGNPGAARAPAAPDTAR